MFKIFILILVTTLFSSVDSIVAGQYVIVKDYNDSFLVTEHIYKDGTLILLVTYDSTNGIKDTTIEYPLPR